MVKPHLLSMLCLSADLLVVLPWRDPFRDLPDRSWQHPGILAVSACGSSLTVELLWATGGVQTSVEALVHWWPASLPTQSMEYVWQHGKPHNGHNGTMANSHRYHTHGAVGWNDARIEMDFGQNHWKRFLRSDRQSNMILSKPILKGWKSTRMGGTWIVSGLKWWIWKTLASNLRCGTWTTVDTKVFGFVEKDKNVIGW